MTLLRLPGLIGLVLFWGAVIVQGYAAVHCLLQWGGAFPAAGKWTKPGWAVVTVVAFLVTLVFRTPLGLLPLVGLVASFVYLVDVRPAVREVSRGRGGPDGQETGRW